MARDPGQAGLDPERLGQASPLGGQLPGAHAPGQHLGVGPAHTAGAGDRPRKSTARLLWLLFALFVVYGTTFPFRFSFDFDAFLALAGRVNWRLLGGTEGDIVVSDIVANVLLFIPYGFLGYFSLVYKRSWWRKAAIVASGLALSTFVEFLQIFSPARCPWLSDVIFNTAGTAAGLVLAMGLKKTVLGFKSRPMARRFLDAPSAFPAFIFMVAMAAGCLQPFDFSLDVGMLREHVKSLIRDPFELKKPDDDMISFIRFLFSALFLSRLAHEAGFRRPALLGAAAIGALGVGLEFCQIALQSRVPEAQDALVALIGAAAGGIAWFFPGFHLRPRIWGVVGMSMILLSAAARALYPFEFSPAFSGINLLPFLPHYERSTFSALGDFMESAMIFFPLGFLLGYFYPRIRPSALAALLAGGMALAVELAQGFVPGRYADLTDVLGAMAGGIAGGLALTRGWPAFREYMARDDDNQV